MSVVGYDDAFFASELSPALTTVRQPTYQLGRTAAELLLAEVQPGHRHAELLFRPELVVRRSTAPPALRQAKRLLALGFFGGRCPHAWWTGSPL
ncbi:DNA-binding LacI/PurR family transcriptional regulator [Allocatelliglobosispora scoriae]|uniref:DNA-binding LacI/PurR family transcriptional regulator n=2 Tax=Allocatelliglobosispora scoriae TaxID=643052 RepID=A0A841BM38_9ACTN|nr:DNA-binding LacI/PurR family transcriptional regulator [Allocatelliglobosispora scoriae]